MTREVVGMKAAKATQLTPVGAEQDISPALQFAQGESPYSGLRDALRRVRSGMAMLDKYVGALERDAEYIAEHQYRAVPGDELAEALAAPVETVSTSFADDFKAKQLVAQEATFSPAPNTAEASEGTQADDGWACPEHGHTAIAILKSPRGRVYRSCTEANCNQFEK
jgi:hypothetical protein